MQERKRLEDIIKELPEDIRKELEDFAHYLWEKRRKKLKRNLNLIGLVLFLILQINLPLLNYSIKYQNCVKKIGGR